QPLTTPRYTAKREMRRCRMAIEITMPRLSDTMEEGKILKWLKKVGDRIEVGDIIAEVETDKADMEMEALDAGVLAEIRVQEGESAPVNAVIAVLSEDGSVSAGPPERPKSEAPRPAVSAPPSAEAKETPRPTVEQKPAASPAPGAEAKETKRPT